ncbi:MAG: SLBB domain-containing protein [Chitinophagaceae bacterium]
MVGRSENGSYRNIELVRNNKIVLIADFYDYLLKADQKNNIRLEDNDVIRIPFAKVKISLDGEVNRPGIFEIQPNEVLADAINFAGNFKSTAFKARITGTRLLDLEKEILDITKNAYNSFKPIDGDEYLISQIIDKYQNRVTINGAIYKPGTYALNDNLRLSDLLSKAEGLRDDAYSKRITVKRTKDDLSKEIITVDLTDENIVKSFQLKKEDEIEIASIFELKDMYSVTINGAVRKPGIYDFNDSLSLKTLILEAGGFADNATGAGIEISRRKRDAETNIVNGKIVEIIKIDDAKDLSQKSADIKLKPFDIVSIKIDPYYKPQISVSIVGEVFQPGSYSLQSREENISSLIKRSGGLLYTANISGARMRRRNNVNDIDLTVVKKIAQTSANDSSNVLVDNAARSVNDVAIDLEEILKNPGGPEDIFLAEGDEIYIPVINNMISIEGEVFKPLDVAFTYEKGKKLKAYISDAGGTTSAALEKRYLLFMLMVVLHKQQNSGCFLENIQKLSQAVKYLYLKPLRKQGLIRQKPQLLFQLLVFY